MTDRAARWTGYACIAAALAMAAWALGILVQEFRTPDRVLRVRFPELGTLMEQDPVVLNGVPVGRVRAIFLQDGPMAEIGLFRGDVFLPRDSRFVNFSHSPMGDRRVALLPGNSTFPMEESRIQEGLFLPGVAENLHRAGELLEGMEYLRARILGLFATGSPLSPEGLARLESHARAMKSLAERTGETERSLGFAMTAWTNAVRVLRDAMKSAGPALAAAGSGAGSLADAVSSQQQLEIALASAENLLARLSDSSGTFQALIRDRSAYEELEASLRVFNDALRAIGDENAKDIVKWRNIHFFRSGKQP